MKLIAKFLRRLTESILRPILIPLIREALAPVSNQFLQNQIKDPIDLYILQNSLFFNGGHFNPAYQEMRMRRIAKILEIFGLDFKGKRILELGGGAGDMGAFFASLGAEVTSAEYRNRNIVFANIRYRNIPTFQSVFFDGEKDFTHLGKFDIIICTAFLEVIENFENVLRCMAKMTNNIILETTVSDSLLQNFNGYHLHGDASDGGVSGAKGSRPSPKNIERMFDGWNINRHFTEDLNTDTACYDWKHKNDGVWGRDSKSLRRFWHFKK